MTEMIKKNFDVPNETRPIPKGKAEVLNFGELQPMCTTFEPGCRCSESVRPIVNTASCQVHHLIYFLSGRMGVRMDDGTEMEFGPRDIGEIPEGHDAWVIGDESAVGIDFRGDAIYAKPQS